MSGMQVDDGSWPNPSGQKPEEDKVLTDRPILFSAPMIRALMEGRKTQTRRILKPQPPQGHELVGIYAPGLTAVFNPAGRNNRGDPDQDHMVRLFSLKDRLWVKETWATGRAYDDLAPREMGGDEQIKYSANGLCETRGWPNRGDWGRNRVSIHMPRWASRLTLTITDVRVQRVQDISEQNAMAEGVEHDQDRSRGNAIGWWDYLNRGGKCGTARGSFQSLWDSLNASRAPWAENPWVVAYTFTVHQCNIDQMETVK